MAVGHWHVTDSEFSLMEMWLEIHHQKHLLLVEMVNIWVVWLPPGKMTQAGELDNPELSRVLAKGQNGWRVSSGFILFYLKLSEMNPILITNDPREDSLSEAFSLNDIKFYYLILLWIYLYHYWSLLLVWVFGAVTILPSVFLESAPLQWVTCELPICIHTKAGRGLYAENSAC